MTPGGMGTAPACSPDPWIPPMPSPVPSLPLPLSAHPRGPLPSLAPWPDRRRRLPSAMCCDTSCTKTSARKGAPPSWACQCAVPGSGVHCRHHEGVPRTAFSRHGAPPYQRGVGVDGWQGSPQPPHGPSVGCGAREACHASPHRAHLGDAPIRAAAASAACRLRPLRLSPRSAPRGRRCPQQRPDVSRAGRGAVDCVRLGPQLVLDVHRTEGSRATQRPAAAGRRHVQHGRLR